MPILWMLLSHWQFTRTARSASGHGVMVRGVVAPPCGRVLAHETRMVLNPKNARCGSLPLGALFAAKCGPLLVVRSIESYPSIPMLTRPCSVTIKPRLPMSSCAIGKLVPLPRAQALCSWWTPCSRSPMRPYYRRSWRPFCTVCPSQKR